MTSLCLCGSIAALVSSSIGWGTIVWCGVIKIKERVEWVGIIGQQTYRVYIVKRKTSVINFWTAHRFVCVPVARWTIQSINVVLYLFWKTFMLDLAVRDCISNIKNIYIYINIISNPFNCYESFNSSAFIWKSIKFNFKLQFIAINVHTAYIIILYLTLFSLEQMSGLRLNCKCHTAIYVTFM